MALTGSVIAIASEVLDPVPSAGDFTVNCTDGDAYFHPVPVLTYRQRKLFPAGRGHFSCRWVVFAANGDWGMGPTSTADRCSHCDQRARRSTPPECDDEQSLSIVVRVSFEGEDKNAGPKPHPHYGTQLQNRAALVQFVESL